MGIRLRSKWPGEEWLIRGLVFNSHDVKYSLVSVGALVAHSYCFLTRMCFYMLAPLSLSVLPVLMKKANTIICLQYLKWGEDEGGCICMLIAEEEELTTFRMVKVKGRETTQHKCLILFWKFFYSKSLCLIPELCVLLSWQPEGVWVKSKTEHISFVLHI